MKLGDAWFDAQGSLRGPCLFRVFAGPLAILHLWPFWSSALRGDYYRQRFYVPWIEGYPELPLWAYTALLSIGIVSAAAMMVGLGSRLATRVTFGVVTYNFFLSETFFHHNRVFLLIFLAGLSLISSGDSVSIDALRRAGPEPVRPLWPLWLWRAEACVPYLASSTSKLLDPDWFGGVVTWGRVQRYRQIGAQYVPAFVMDLVTRRELHSVLAKLTIALELAIGFGLLWQTTRYLAVWLAIVFHFLIEVSARVQVFSLLGMCGVLIWVTPRTRDRTLLLRADDMAAGRLRWLVRWFDWLARFEVRDAGEGAAAIELRERDGTTWTGRAARLRVLSRLPLTAFFVLPFLGWDLRLRAQPVDS